MTTTKQQLWSRTRLRLLESLILSGLVPPGTHPADTITAMRTHTVTRTAIGRALSLHCIPPLTFEERRQLHLLTRTLPLR